MTWLIRSHLLNFLFGRRRRCHGQIIDIVASKRTTQKPQFAELWLNRMALNVHQIVLEIWVCVRVAVGEVNCIVVMLKFDIECQRKWTNIATVVIIKVINQHLMIVSCAVDVVIIITKVRNVLAAPLPSDIIVSGICRRVHKWSHSFLIQTIRLC